MKHTLAILTFAATIAFATAQEKVSPEETQKIGQKLLDTTGQIENAPVKITPNLDKADAVKAGDAGALVIPDKELTAALLAKAGKELVPVGQLYCKGITYSVNGKVIAPDKLREVKISDKDQTHHVPLCLLAARRHDGKLELVVFGKDKSPVATLALKESSASQDLPIELTVEKDGEESGRMKINLFGKYEASLIVTRKAE